MNEREQALISLGIDLFTKAVNKSAYSFDLPLKNIPDEIWQIYRSKLGAQGSKQGFLTNILSLIQLKPIKSENDSVVSNFLIPQALCFGEITELKRAPICPCDLKTVKEKYNPNTLWNEFEKEVKDLLNVKWNNTNDKFECFYYLFRKYAWSLPCTYGEIGVSLFEEWKTIVALVFASGNTWKDGPAENFSLVGGDIPGIQDFVFTITSKGAAKGLRGRSFFLQLLGEAVIQAMLKEMEICYANVIYAAGGNFMLLGPKLEIDCGGKTVQQRLAETRNRLESILLEEFQGDLTTCLEWIPLSIDQIGTEEFSNKASKELKEKISIRKHQRFYEIMGDHWEGLFAPRGRPGDDRCDVCQRPVGKTTGSRCNTCTGFQELAASIGQAGELIMVVSDEKPKKTGNWQEILFRLCGSWFSFRKAGKILTIPGRRYLLNNTDFLEKKCIGYKFFPNVTPRVNQLDVVRWRNSLIEDDQEPSLGDIRSFSQMADFAEGIHRVGVLRMDVDNLGQIMVSGLPNRTLTTTSELSWSLDLFFSGWLSKICTRVNDQNRTDSNKQDLGERLYVIYAGGDDLFVVGSWDLMPILAEAIRDDFVRYSSENPNLTISGGITLHGRKFPLYHAAEEAGKAEEYAKHYLHRLKDKDALCFLGIVVRWEEWDLVDQFRKQIQKAVGEKKAPQALIQVLSDIYDQYVQQRGKEHKRRGKIPDDPDAYMYYGPWMWRSGYALTRMASQIRRQYPEIAKEVSNFQSNCLDAGNIRLIGLAARWAELLMRKEN